MAVEKCEKCKKSQEIRAQVCGAATICGHQTGLAGDAFCGSCAEREVACITCGTALSGPDIHPNIIRGED